MKEETSNTNNAPPTLEEMAFGLSAYLPPWHKASASQRLQLVLYNLAVGLPLLTLLCLSTLISVSYYALYLYPLIFGSDKDLEVYYWQTDSERERARQRGIAFGVLCSWCFLWFLICLYKAVTTSPGSIPEGPEWHITGDEADESTQFIVKDNSKERKKDGTLRTCSRCLRRKPDRCHHCRLCDRCVLKMDHHCPWILNCVGYYNYKYFILLVLYSSLSLAIISGSFWETVIVTLANPSSSVVVNFVIVMIYSLELALTAVIVPFCGFHFWLIYQDMTTIEFCEKRRTGAGITTESTFRKTLATSLASACGSNWWCWCFPFCYRNDEDRGLKFERVPSLSP
mmetsp:Transcript_18633/g.33675  ORF Transcript_18633/g.33675 Transcript_18633/m.33675 type:complete len:341 (-) Transcript_18633:50-1072(-)